MKGQRAVFLESGRTDTVTAVLIPMDGVTRAPVSSGVTAQLWDPVRREPRPNRLIRNLSGQLVLVNEAADQDLTFRILPEAAGYRGPLFVTFNPAVAGHTRVVALERRPDSSFDPTETVVRGVVVRSAASGFETSTVPVPGLNVTARPPAEAAGHQFPATTDERGVFALVVGLKVVSASEGPVPVPVLLRFEKAGLPAREIEVDLDQGRVSVFAAPINLDEDIRPRFAHQAGHEEPEHDE